MKAQCERTATSGRRHVRRAERRESILNVAQKSFLEEGYAGTTMSAVATALGGSKGTLWQYFPSKLELFAAVIDRLAKQPHLDLTDTLNSKLEFTESLSRFCEYYITIICSPTAISVHRLIISESNRFPEIGKTFFSQTVGITRKILSDFIGRFMVENIDFTTDSNVAAEFLMSLCHGRCFRNLIFGLSDFVSEEDIGRDVEISVSAFMKTFGCNIKAIHKVGIN